MTAKDIIHDRNGGNSIEKNDCDTTTKTLHIAPMLHVSNAEFRHFFRILSKKCVLWTEMVVDETIVYNLHDKDLLESHLGMVQTTERPVVCQIGGISAEMSAKASTVVEDCGYDEINLNMDCPSDRVSGKRQFGAVLMKKLDQAVSIVHAMKVNVRDIPVSVKCRVGVDEFDSMDYLVKVIERLKHAGCTRFVLHARKCLLSGLTPEQNRLVPPLNYPRVYALCERFPDCQFWINGGISGLKKAKELAFGTAAVEAKRQSAHCRTSTIHTEGTQTDSCLDVKRHQVPCSLCRAPNGSCTIPPDYAPPNLLGCMIGRAATDNPAQFWDVDRYFYGCPTNPCQNRRELLHQYCCFLEKTYPHRCCDDDVRITNRIPAPDITPSKPSCGVCREISPENDCTKTLVVEGERSSDIRKRQIKITSRVIDRSLKPVLGIFFGLPGSKSFRRQCDILSRDTTVRNCGPAFILRKACHVMPAKILDQPFLQTQELRESDITVHISPLGCSACLG